MAEWAKYQKISTVVGVSTMVGTIDMGSLGTLVSGDKLINLADGSLHTMDASSFALKYTAAADTATLTGDQWD